MKQSKDDLDAVLHWRGKFAAEAKVAMTLRQQLADVSNERDELRKQRDAILMQARVWAGEAKTQRSTVESVGAILGGIPDWGPIAAGVEALQIRLNASEARCGEAIRLLRGVHTGDLFGPEDWETVNSFLSAPAACGQCKASTSETCNQNGCGYLESGNGVPATDEQGAGS